MLKLLLADAEQAARRRDFTINGMFYDPIKKEILDVESGRIDLKDNVLKNAPHTAQHAASDSWNHSYTRAEAAYPAEWTRESKFWPAVSRIDNAHGDRNLVCTCPPIEQHEN